MKLDLKKFHGSKRTLHNGVYASLLAVAVLAAVILLNLVVRALPTRYTEFDISTSALFTLSDTSKNLLRELPADVTAYYLAQSGQEDANITRLLDRYADETDRFRWETRDPVLYPTFAQAYEGATVGGVVVTCGDRYEVMDYSDMYPVDTDALYYSGTEQYTFDAENQLTVAISKVIRTASYRLYELTGHGETALESDFTDTLDNGGTTVEGLNLTTAGAIPADAAGVLVNAPLTDLTDAETQLLRDYLAGGGSLVVATDFTVSAPNLDALLAEYDMTRQTGLLVETDTDHYPYGYPQTYLLPVVQPSEITAGVLSNMMLYAPIAQGIVLDEESTLDLTPLLTTSDTAYSMQNYVTAETATKADTDPEGSFTVAAAARNKDTGAKVVWINCPNMLLGMANQSVSGANAQLLGSIVNWCNGEQTTAVISTKSLSAAGLNVPNGAKIALGLLFTLVLPIVCLIAGVVVCLVRRRR